MSVDPSNFLGPFQLDSPYPRYGWRRLLQEATIPYLVRANLFALGFQYITIKGKPAPRSEAPIQVCNHQSFMDIWFFLWRCLPVGVSAAENMRFPVMGDLMLSQQTIFVDREDKDSGLKAAALISGVAKDPRWPCVVIYPEGNTNNGRQLCAFKLGPFQPGLPVQPLVVSYRRNHPYVDPCWVEPLGMPVHLVAIRLMLQWHNYMDVTYLPVMSPSAAEVKEPALFAARVKKAMAKALQVGQTEHSFADTRLMFAARKLHLPLDSAVLEIDKAARVWGVGYADCKEALERFAAAGGPGAAWLDGPQLLSALRLSAGEVSQPTAAALLATFSRERHGRVSYRELVAGLAPLARQAKAKGDKRGFVERAVGLIRERHLAQL